MPKYLVKIDTDVILDPKGLDTLEDVVYDTLVDKFGGSTNLKFEVIDQSPSNGPIVACVGGVTDVHAVYN